jgi:hypothetical protein
MIIDQKAKDQELTTFLLAVFGAVGINVGMLFLHLSPVDHPIMSAIMLLCLAIAVLQAIVIYIHKTKEPETLIKE